MRKVSFCILIVAFLPVLTSCTGGSAVTTGADSVTHPTEQVSTSSHQFWGLWQLVANPAAGTLDIIPLRAGNFHLNALTFLEPPPLVNLTLESLEFNGDIIEAGIGLRHPFIGLTEFTGFDVCGIFITNGSVTGFDDPELRMAGDGDTRLLNPDGYTRWWNPAEFPHGNTIFNYKDGLLGTPDSSADYNSTLNAYKYFCDELGPDAPVSKATAEKRGMFSAGQKNIRHYTIELGTDGLIFNYAVDASWHFPTGGKPWVAPDDFPPAANRSEAWNINITETENTLWNDGTGYGGNLSLVIDVWDHFNAGLNSVKVESNGNFIPVVSSTPIGGGEGYCTYEIDITDGTPVAAGTIDLLISVACEEEGYGGILEGKPVTAYFTSTAQVSGESPAQKYHLEWDPEKTIVSNQPSWDDISPALAVETDDETVVAWVCNYQGSPGTMHYQNFSRSSDGESWPAGTNCFPGGDNKGDFVKCAAGTNGTSFSTFAQVFGVGDPPYNPYVTWNEDYSLGGNYCFPHNDLWSDIEVFVAQTGKVFVFTDYDYDLTAGGIIDVQHSIGANTLDGVVDWWDYPYFTVATDGLISHSRSIGDTSDGTMHLAYYSQDGKAIMLVSSTDGSTGEAWGTPVTVIDDSAYSNYIDPSLAMDGGDALHVTCSVYSPSDSAYKILYMHADSPSGPFSAPVVVCSIGVPLGQPAVDVRDYPGGKAIFVSWLEAGTVFASYSFDGIAFAAPVVVQETFSMTQQPDCIVDHMGNLQVVWSQYNATNWEITIRRARMVPD